jgi:hypothetical protein
MQLLEAQYTSLMDTKARLKERIHALDGQLPERANRGKQDRVRRNFFAKITSNQVKYDVVAGYGKLMELVA